jgi:hypothetical protein
MMMVMMMMMMMFKKQYNMVTDSTTQTVHTMIEQASQYTMLDAKSHLAEHRLLVVDRASRVRGGIRGAGLGHEHHNCGPELLSLALSEKMLGGLIEVERTRKGQEAGD